MTPFSLDAERGLVARLLLEPAQLSTVTLDPDDLLDPDARAAFAAMQSLSEKKQDIDILALKREAGRDLDIGTLELTGAHRAPVSTYAEMIARDAWRRRTIERLNSVALHAESEADPTALIDHLHSTVEGIEEDANLLATDRKGTFGVMDLDEYRHPPAPLLLDVLSPVGTTILYGDGGDGKGWVAAKWAASLGLKVAVLDFEMQPSEWAYRFDKFGLTPDQYIYLAPPMTFERWATESTARFLRQEGVGFLLVDSAMYASDTDDPYSPKGALGYGRARRKLDNLPALLLAHTTGNQDKIFSSVFWRNESRIVWRLSKDVNRQRYLECRKANNYSFLEGQKLVIEFNEERGILNTHVHGTAWSPEPEAVDF